MHAWLFMLAEVMDKEPAAIEYWLLAAFVAAAGFFAVKWRARMLLIVLPFTLSLFGGVFLHVNDPCMRAAIIDEAGRGYLAQVNASLVLVLLGPLVPVVRADLPNARAWWSSIVSRRSTNAGASAPYRASAPATSAVSPPWRLLLVFITVAATLVALALLQGHRLLHRCIWVP